MGGRSAGLEARAPRLSPLPRLHCPDQTTVVAPLHPAPAPLPVPSQHPPSTRPGGSPASSWAGASAARTGASSACARRARPRGGARTRRHPEQPRALPQGCRRLERHCRRVRGSALRMSLSRLLTERRVLPATFLASSPSRALLAAMARRRHHPSQGHGSYPEAFHQMPRCMTDSCG